MALDLELEKVLQEFAIHNDTDLVMVAIESTISSDGGGGMDSITHLLLQPQNEVVLQKIAWDLFLMIVPHLKTLKSSTFTLISHIAKVGQVKEMCIGFLEGLDKVVSVDTVELLLIPLATVISRISTDNQKLLCSTLTSTYSIITRNLTALLLDGTDKQTKPNTMVDNTEDDDRRAISIGMATRITFITNTLGLLEVPFRLIHDIYSNNYDGGWTDLQRVCIKIVSDTIGAIMMASKKDGDEEAISRLIEGVTRCHCGGLQLLEQRHIERRRTQDKDEEIEDEEEEYNGHNNDKDNAPLTNAILSCLLLNEDSLYTPRILSHQYRLHLGLAHISCILDNESLLSNHRLTSMALSVLMCLLQRISPHSLPTVILDDPRYKRTLLLLCRTMASSPVTRVREQSVSMLGPFIQCFHAHGRYKLYDILLREIDHPGIKGLVIQLLKDEVNEAMRACPDSAEASCFLGEKLKGLYQQFLVSTSISDILLEYDRYMAGLNFLRFLLLRDVRSINKTLIWSIRESVINGYLKPVQSAIVSSSMYCKSLQDNPDEFKRRRNEYNADSVNMEVQILGEMQVPEMSYEEEMELLQKSLLRLDMIRSVLARVEELI